MVELIYNQSHSIYKKGEVLLQWMNQEEEEHVKTFDSNMEDFFFITVSIQIKIWRIIKQLDVIMIP